MPRSRPRPLTPREHLALGAELSDIDHRLRAVWIALDRAYGLKGSRRAKSVHDRLCALRSWLDDQVCTELPRAVTEIEGVPVTQAYYGWREGPGGSPEITARINAARELLTEAAEHVFDGGNPWLRERAT